MGRRKYWAWEQKVAITDETIGISQLLGARALAFPPPKSTPMHSVLGIHALVWEKLYLWKTCCSHSSPCHSPLFLSPLSSLAPCSLCPSPPPSPKGCIYV